MIEDIRQEAARRRDRETLELPIPVETRLLVAVTQRNTGMDEAMEWRAIATMEQTERVRLESQIDLLLEMIGDLEDRVEHERKDPDGD